jgi:hypothetical protein
MSIMRKMTSCRLQLIKSLRVDSAAVSPEDMRMSTMGLRT